MIITADNKQDIVNYIISITRYQETFSKVYDHVLSALSASDQQNFDLSLVKEIVACDFGSLEQISDNEHVFEKAFVRSCLRDLIAEMISAFKFPAICLNAFLLLVCLLVIQFSKSFSWGIKHFATGILLGIVLLSIAYLFNRYIYKRNQKPSIKYRFIERALCIYSAFSFNMTMLFLNKNSLFEVPSPVKILLAMAIFLTLSNFLFAYRRVYNKRLRILRLT